MPGEALSPRAWQTILPVERMPEAPINTFKNYYVNGAKVGVERTEARDRLNQVPGPVRTHEA